MTGCASPRRAWGTGKYTDYASASQTILEELTCALRSVRQEQVDQLVAAIAGARRVFVIGAGRVGFASQAFAMRLMHLGVSAWYVSDVTTPAIGPGDLLLIPSGSGETRSMCVVADRAASLGATVATITRQPSAHIGRVADVVVELMAEAGAPGPGCRSIQPMTTLFEQGVFLLLDAVVLLMMERMGQPEAEMVQRHRNVE